MSDAIKAAAASGKEILAFSPNQRGGSDAAYVKGQYEDHWGQRIHAIKAKIDEGETTAHIMAAIRSAPHLINGYNRVAARIASKLLPADTPVSATGIPLARLGVSAGRFAPVSNFDPMTAIFELAREADIIVELGAGPGWNLFNLATYLGKAIKGKRLFGLEFTDAGLEIMHLLGRHESLPLSVHFFDYTNPDLSMLPSDGSMLIFSHHSIEQVEDISPALHAKIARRKASTTLVHCEPIGWQRFPELVRARLNGNDLLFHSLVTNRMINLEGLDAVALNAAINSWRVGYNRNAYALIQKYVKHSRFRIEEEYFDFTQLNNNNPANPSTYIKIKINS